MLTSNNIRTLLVAGVIGQLAFEAYAWLISPLLFGPSLQPANLVMALSNIYLGLTLNYMTGFIVHAAIGVIGFSVFVALVHKITKTRLILSGVMSGLILWFVAQGMLAPAVGRPFMMEFGAYTQSSFVAHVGMTTIIAFVMQRLGGLEGAANEAEALT